ncbi:ATP-grasp domain-containing protein [Paraburkholderia nemoris]|uniref:ATP-grasp domain-containing protein n=1 Tax=Paraburkholderia nemoris TaxID=2793076 RepID=UPI0038BB1AAE
MKRIAFTRSTEIQNAAPYLPNLQAFFENRGIHAKLFYSRGDCRKVDFPGETEKVDESISARGLAERLIRWNSDGVISLAIPDENAVRDALVREILASHEIPVIAHPVLAAQVLSNKWDTKLALAQFNLKTPTAHLLDGDLLNQRNISFPVYRELVLRNAQEIGYPVLTKPLWDSLGNGIGFYHDEDELKSFLDVPYNGNVVLEKFSAGTLCSVEVMGTDGQYVFQPILWKGLTELKSTLFFNEVRHSVIDRHAERIFSKVKDHIIEFCNHFRISGVIEVEMIFYEDDYYVIEINPRVSGTTVLSAASSGINTFEALTHMVLGSWPEFTSQIVEHGNSEKFSLQFPYIDGANLDSLGEDISLIKINDFHRNGTVYRNAIVSGRYEKLSELGQGIESGFRVNEEVSEKIRRLSHASKLARAANVEREQRKHS